MIQAIHQSMLNMALRCGEQFRRRYIEGEIIPPSIAAARGIGVHKANQVNLSQKIYSEVDLPEGDLTDAARDAYVNTLKQGVYLTKDEIPHKDRLIGEGLDDTVRATSLYRKDVAPAIKPAFVEEKFTLDLGFELPLRGTIDYGTEKELGDIKTSSRKWAEGRAKAELQPVLYSLIAQSLFQKRFEWMYYILITRRSDSGKPTSMELQKEPVEVEEKQYLALGAKIKVFIDMLKSGVFPPANQTSWWCSPNWCGYWSTCPYVGNPLPGKWV